MLLATVTNDKFFFNAINLIDSYKFNSFDDEILFFSLNLAESYKKHLKKRYGSQVHIQDIPKVCNHAHDVKTFFYKTYAIKAAMNHGQDFIYSDATNEIVKFTTDLKEDLKKRGGRIILPYNHEMLKNKYWTTKKCFEKMGCLEEKYGETPQHWAGTQIYAATEENKQFVGEMCEHMLDIEVAGPDMTAKRPDGENSLCIEHRCDQSVLSILMKKYGFYKDFDLELAHKYGDQQTLVDFDKTYRPQMDKIVIYSRKSKFIDYSNLEV